MSIKAGLVQKEQIEQWQVEDLSRVDSVICDVAKRVLEEIGVPSVFGREIPAFEDSRDEPKEKNRKN